METRMDRRSTRHVPQEARGYCLSVLQACAVPMLGYAALTQPARLNDRPAIRFASYGLHCARRSVAAMKRSAIEVGAKSREYVREQIYRAQSTRLLNS